MADIETTAFVEGTERPEALPQQLITAEETARILSMSRWKVYDEIRCGRLPSVKVGRLRRVIASALPDYIERLRRETADES